MKKRTFAEALQGGLMGGIGGSQAGMPFGTKRYDAAGNLIGQSPVGALVGGGLGLLTGIAGGLLDAQGNEDADALNMEEQGLNNSLLKENLVDAKRKNRTAQSMENGMNLFRGYLGAAFKSSQPGTMAGALKPYPGLGNQGVA